MYEDLFRAGDIRKDTGHSDIFAAVPSEADERLTEAQLQELKHLTSDADIAVMLTRIKELIPAYTGWPRKTGKQGKEESGVESRESGEGKGREEPGPEAA